MATMKLSNRVTAKIQIQGTSVLVTKGISITIVKDNGIYLPMVMKEPIVIQNGGFETELSSENDWTNHSVFFSTLRVSKSEMPSLVPPHTGDFAVWLGGRLGERSYLSQTVMIPVGYTTLNFYRWLQSEEICGGDEKDFGGVQIRIDGTPLQLYSWTLCQSEADPTWQNQQNLFRAI